MRLTDELTRYRDSGVYPMHMPGHKRRSTLTLPCPYEIDITEIEGFDNLHDASGILLEGMRKAAALYGSRQTFYLVNGSTCGILAGITALTKKGDRILAARNSHKSVYNAISLWGLEAVFLSPMEDESFGVPASISPASVQDALEEHPDIRLIVITSPTYEGVVSDVAQIAKITHAHGVPLLVDEAHGAHLGFHSAFPKSSVQAGADIVIHSVHKTLPSLTQAALMHVNGSFADPGEVRRQLAVFESSSPSYVLMASIDSCVSLLCEQKEGLFASYLDRLSRFSARMRALDHIRILCKGDDGAQRHPNIFDYDPGKIVMSVRNTNLTGPILAKRLLEQYGIELEMALGDYAVAMTSICDTQEGFTRLGDALLDTDSKLVLGQQPPKSGVSYAIPESAMPIYAAQCANGQFVALSQSSGRISREYVYAYPPGVPMLVPGEVVSAQILEKFGDLIRKGVELKSTCKRVPHEINVIA